VSRVLNHQTVPSGIWKYTQLSCNDTDRGLRLKRRVDRRTSKVILGSSSARHPGDLINCTSLHKSPLVPTISATMVGLTSAAGLVGYLSEPAPELQVFALEQLNEEMDSIWTEVSASIGQM
jgi:hypothetical protein